MLRVAIVAALALLVPTPTSVTAAAFPRLPRECVRSDFRSAGAPVRAALCVPPGRGRFPAAIVLHGCGGFDTFDHRLAVDLPHAGIATLYVDYFDPTPPPGDKGFCSGDGGSGRDVFAIWQHEVVAAAVHLRSVRSVDPSRLALVGWSLGGGLAVAAVVAHGSLFEALVGFSTGFFGPVGHLAGVPTTLLLSAGPRDAVPLAATRHLAAALRSAGVEVSFYDYGHGVHSWPASQGTAGIAVAERFLRRTLRA
jgi:dienelactone hydrolase